MFEGFIQCLIFNELTKFNNVISNLFTHHIRIYQCIFNHFYVFIVQVIVQVVPGLVSPQTPESVSIPHFCGLVLHIVVPAALFICLP